MLPIRIYLTQSDSIMQQKTAWNILADTRQRFTLVFCVVVLLVTFGQPHNASAAAPQAETLDHHAQAAPPSSNNAVASDEKKTLTIEDVQRLSNDVLKKVVEIRGIQHTTPVPVEARSDEELRAYLLEQLNKDERAHLIQTDQILHMLRVLKPEDDLLTMALSLLLEEIAGYYEPDEKRFYVRDHHLQDIDPVLLAHELQHAVQDETWNLSAMIRPSWRQPDTLAARSALIEGDATLTMLAYNAGRYLDTLPKNTVPLMVKTMRRTMLMRKNTLPSFLLQDLLFPYADGLLFVFALYEHGGWDAVNRAFTHPPTSTAQILYPDRYLSFKQPLLLGYDLPASRFGERQETTIWGMASTQYLFEHLLDKQKMRASVKDTVQTWNGDRIELWKNDSTSLLVWLTAHQNVQGAQQYFHMLHKTLPAWSDGAVTCAQGTHGERCANTTHTRGVSIERWGDLTLVLIADNHRGKTIQPSYLLQAAEEVFHSIRRSNYPETWRSVQPSP